MQQLTTSPSPFLLTVTLWLFFVYDFANGIEEYVVQVEHSFDLGHTWLQRGQVQLPLKQGTLEKVIFFKLNFTFSEMNSFRQLVHEKQRYFIRASKIQESAFPKWLITSYRACRLVELNLREVIYIYLDSNLEDLIGLGADFPLHGFCNHTIDWSLQEEPLGQLEGYWYIKTPQFPKFGLDKTETLSHETLVTEEQSFIEKNRWFLIAIGVLLVLNAFIGWIRFRLYMQNQSNSVNHPKTD